jgi:hypothetical protein
MVTSLFLEITRHFHAGSESIPSHIAFSAADAIGEVRADHH